MPNPRRRKPLPRDQRGLIDKIRRGEVIHDETPVELEVLLEYQKECGIVEEQEVHEPVPVVIEPPGNKLKLEQTASVILVKAKDRKDRKNDDSRHDEQTP